MTNKELCCKEFCGKSNKFPYRKDGKAYCVGCKPMGVYCDYCGNYICDNILNHSGVLFYLVILHRSDDRRGTTVLDPNWIACQSCFDARPQIRDTCILKEVRDA